MVPAIPKGEHVIPKPAASTPKVRWPFDPALAVVKVWSYSVTEKGSVIGVSQSSQWLPMSSTPGTKVAVSKAKV